jgi:phosphate starvation-inducible protein PhoH and related proteins
VRHPLVQRLVEAYADRDATNLAPAVKRRFDSQWGEPEP